MAIAPSFRALPRCPFAGLAALVVGATLTASSAARPEADNAAPIYDSAQKLLGQPGDPSQPPMFDDAAWTRISSVLDGGPITPQVRADLARAREVLDLAQKAAAISHIDRGLDRSDGFGLLLPHLATMRQIARVALADAAVRLADGDADGAGRAFATTLGMAKHVADDRLMIGTLVSASIGAHGGDQLQRAIDLGSIDPEQAAIILKSAEVLPSSDPFGFVTAIDGELEMVRATVHGVLDEDERFDELVDDPEGAVGAEVNPFAGRPREEVLAELETTERLYGEVVEAVSDPDPDRARERLSQLEARIRNGEGGMLGQLVMPAFSQAFEMTLRAEAALKTPLAELRAIANGTKVPGEFVNAAPWLRQAAAAAIRIDPDEQRLIEALRVAPEAFDDPRNAPVLAEMREIAERHRDAVIAPLLKAAEAGRCRFRKEATRHRELLGIPEYAAGLRGAVRLLLADAMLGESADHAPERDDTDEPAAERPATEVKTGNRAVDRLRAAIRIIELIAGDASIAHALLATGTAADLVATAPAILQRTTVDGAATAALRTTVESMDRADPMGHRRGLDADRNDLVRHFRCDDAMRARRVELAARLDGNQAMALLLLLQTDDATADAPTGAPTGACGRISPGPSANLGDLYDDQACAAIAAMRDRLIESPVLLAQGDTPTSVRDPLGGIVVPIVVDTTRLELLSVTLIGELDRIVRRAAAVDAAVDAPSSAPVR